MNLTDVRIKMNGSFVMETDIGEGYPGFQPTETVLNIESSIFQVDMDKIWAGTEIKNKKTGHYMCSRTNRWTIYAMTEKQQDDKDKRLWFLHKKDNKIILKNVNDNNGVHWEIDDGRNVMREKTSDSSCDPVAFVPASVEESKISIRETTDIRWLAQNTTSSTIETSIESEESKKVIHEVMREEFKQLTSSVKFSVSQTSTGPNVPAVPSVESTAAFETELGLMSTWKSYETTTTETFKKVSQSKVTLAPMTGDAFKRVTWTYLLDDKYPIMIDQHAFEVRYNIDKDGNIVH